MKEGALFYGIRKKIKIGFLFTFEKTRETELIIAVSSTWWLLAVIFGHATVAPQVQQKNNHEIFLIFVGITILMWLNLYRKIDDIRKQVLLLTVGWWSSVATFFVLFAPSAPSVATYVGMTWLTIFNALKEPHNGGD